MPRFLYIANWKMTMHANAAIAFATEHGHALSTLAQHNEATIIVCPSFVVLDAIIQLLQNSHLAVGAQDCSAYASGAYTGQVSAQSLQEIGCTYTLVGHRERREYFQETNEMISQKVARLLECNIQPIICIGQAKHHAMHDIYPELEKQLVPVLAVLAAHNVQSCIIAYEPAAHIGTHMPLDAASIERIVIFIKQMVARTLPTGHVQVVYGGGVNSASVASLKSITLLDGFLIGQASTDFQNFEKIVSCR